MDFTGLSLILVGAVASGSATMLISPRLPRLHLEAPVARFIALLLVLAWSTLIGALAILQHLSFNTSAYDLGIFDQVIWNSAQGRLFEGSVMADSPSFLGHHFSPILLALVPLYWIYPGPATLLVVQTLLLVLAGVPVFWLARRWLCSYALALALLLAYLLHPATAYIALFDFHEIAFAVPLLSFALYQLLRQRYKLFGIALALAFLTKEDIGLVGAAIGVFILFTQRRWLIGFGLVIIGTLWTLLLVRYVIPGFHPSGEYYFKTLYANLGSTPQDVLGGFLRDPARFFGQMITPGKVTYLQQLFAPLGILPFLGWPVLVISLPSLFSVLLSAHLPPNLIKYQYSATLLPPLLMATVVGLRWLREREANRWFVLAPGLAAFVITSAVIGAYLYGPLPMARGFERQRYEVMPRLEAARQSMAQIPPQASVIAQSGLVPQLSHRRTIQLFAYANPALRPDYYLLDTNSGAQRFPLPQEPDGPYLKALARVTSDAEYRLVAEREGFLLFHREELDAVRTTVATFGNQITLARFENASKQTFAGGTLDLTMYWRGERRPDANYSLFSHLVDLEGKIWGQLDQYPLGEYLPTSEWESGRLWRAQWSIPIASEAPPGEYRLLIGLYDLATMRRLPATGWGSELSGDSITLQMVNLIPAP